MHRSSIVKALGAIALLAFLVSFAIVMDRNRGVVAHTPREPFAPQFSNKSFFDAALENASTTPERTCVGGLVIPHHLLPADKIAKAVESLRGTQFDRIIIMSPDHFTLGQTKISVADRDFNTVYGRFETDQDAVQKISTLPNTANPDFFYREHGIGGLLPFFKGTQPHAKLVAIALRSDARPADLDPLVGALQQIIKDGKTLVVGSIDFSHYLTKAVADTKDAQTRGVLERNVPADVWTLSQPDNLDSRPSLYVQLALQQALDAVPEIADHGNSQDYTIDSVSSTTSYFVVFFNRAPLFCK